MSASLEVAEHHHSAEMAYVQAVGRGVYAKIGCGHLFFQLIFCARHDAVDHAAPGEFFYEVHVI